MVAPDRREDWPDWCEADDCPIHICDGPHVECPGPHHPDLIVTLRFGQTCLICGGTGGALLAGVR